VAEIRCSYCAKLRSSSILGLLGPRGFELEQDWLCSEACLKECLRATVARSLDYLVPEVDYQHRVRIGSILVQRGVITSAQLAEAVKAQSEQGGTIGSHLLRCGQCSEEALTAALSEQQGVPWVGVVESQIPSELSRLIPRQLCADFNVFPFDYDRSEKVICIAARSPVRIALVHLLRKMLDLNVRAFIVGDGSFDRAIEDYLSRRSTAGEVVIQCRRSSREITARLLEETSRIRGRKIRLARYDEAFWARVGRRERWTNCFVSLERVDRVARSTGQSLPEEESVAL